MSTHQPIPEAAIAALRRGSKIEAIKLVREAHQLGLKEAKDQVDQYLVDHPEVQAAGKATTQISLRGCLTFVLLLTALLMTWRYLAS